MICRQSVWTSMLGSSLNGRMLLWSFSMPLHYLWVGMCRPGGLVRLCVSTAGTVQHPSMTSTRMAVNAVITLPHSGHARVSACGST